MSLDLGTLVAYLDVDNTGLSHGLSNAESDMRTSGSRLGSIAKGAGLAILTGLGVAVAAAGGAAVALYSTGIEVDSLGKKAATVFGPELGKATSWASENAAAMGLTRSQAVGLAAGFGDLLIPMGFTREQATKMSTDVIGLSGALSEWSGGQKSASDVADILSSAMLGETDGLKSLGISLSAAEINAGLAARGQDKLTGAALQQATALEIQRQILAKSTDAQKAYADGADEPIRKQALMKARAMEVKEAFATALLPASTAVIGVFLDLSDRALPKLESGLTTAGNVVDKLARQIPDLAGAFRDGDLSGAAEVLDRIFGNTGSKIAGFELALTTARDVLGDVGAVLMDVLLPALTGNSDGVLALLSPLTLANDALGFVADNARVFEAALSVLLPVLGAYKLATIAATTMTAAHNAVTFLRTAATAGLTAAQVGATASTGGLAVGTGLLNAVMAANPVMLVVLAIAALTAGVVVAYRESETFRAIIDNAFRIVKQGGGDMVGFLIQGFRGLLTVWLTVADGIVSGAATALGWIPGLGGKLKAANAAFDVMKTGILGTLDDAAQKAYGFGEKSGSNVARGVNATQQQAFNAGAAVAADMGRGVGSGSGEAYGAGVAVGNNAGRGLVNGLNGYAGAVAAAAQRLAIIAGRAMAGGLQERSPSLVTRKIGLYAGEGLRLGILDTVDAVSAASLQLAGAAVPTLDMPAAPSGVRAVGGDGSTADGGGLDLTALVDELRVLGDRVERGLEQQTRRAVAMGRTEPERVPG